jgi:hypothetical protein
MMRISQQGAFSLRRNGGGGRAVVVAFVGFVMLFRVQLT